MALSVTIDAFEIAQELTEFAEAGEHGIVGFGEAAERGAALTRQLMAFSRNQMLEAKLIDLNLIDYVVEQAEVGPNDVVLEIGTGTGGLTAFLAQNPVDLALVVLNASQVERQIMLLGQIASPDRRVILVLNMADEAAALGISIERETLSSDLGVSHSRRYRHPWSPW